MHDVLGHRLSLLALHAGVLQRRSGEVPEQVRERLGLLRATSTHALEDLRDLLGALREQDADLLPLTPTADDLPGLIGEAEAAGTAVAARIDPLTGLPVALRLAVHRIVQEALTNARKHAPGQPVELTVTVADGRLVAQAANAAPVNGPVAPRGYGLLGVAERVAALHGTLSTGTGPDGRFLLRAELPVSDSEMTLVAVTR
jgi:signal transduction histidine kinase